MCDPRDGSPPGSPVPGILQERTLEWVAISCDKPVYSFAAVVNYFRACDWFFSLKRKQNKEGTRGGGGERMCSE